MLLFFGVPLQAQELDIDSSSEAKKNPTQKSYYVEAGSYGTLREKDATNYSLNFSTIGISSASFYKGVVAGWDSRARMEFRYNDIRRPRSHSEDYPLLLRQRMYLGIIEVLDPFRFAVEFEDARQNNGNFTVSNREANKTDFIQGYAELYFKSALGFDAFGNTRPISLRYGIMAFEFLDRRLIARNNWRNTTNTFKGLRLALGQEKNDWQVDALLVRPINRDIEKLDRTDEDRWFYAVMGHWRKWFRKITLEPYYMGLRQTASVNNNNRQREIHGFGLRLYQGVSDSGFNYDVTGMYQLGKDNGLDHRAYAFTSEIGYSFKSSPLKPRLSVFLGYASGDRDPDDTENNRFERYFGFSRPWSSDDYVIMENIITPKLKMEFQTKIKELTFRFDGGYSFYWLASDTDRFNNLMAGTFNRDPTGNSGSFLGHGLDFRTRFSPVSFIDLNIGYTHYSIGDFVENQQVLANGESANTSNFFYVELSFNMLDFIKHTNEANKN